MPSLKWLNCILKLGFEEVMVSPEFENFSQTEGVTIEPSVNTQSEWKLAYVEENPLIEAPSELAIPETAFNELEDLNIIIPIELQNETEYGQRPN